MRKSTFLAMLTVLITGIHCHAPADKPVPDENRFKRVVLAENLYNPIGLEIAADGYIYMIEANGHVNRVDPITSDLKIIGRIQKSANNHEQGLIGIALDPDFLNTKWIYLQYFLAERQSAQISRFTISGDTILQESEKKYVEVPYQPTCCHSGSGMSFDSKGNLYFATGDNSSAFITKYSPHDDTNEYNNSFRSAANTMDLRGKICRIHPEDDGTFTIPDDNLFPDGKAGRPEIYIMGCRNPFQIYVDKRTDLLYWGEVGPDAAIDSIYGPRGYDEFNIAARAGNYGWPMFIGNNKPYAKVNFKTGEVEDYFNAETPLNTSLMNTGIKELPPAQQATIWYPYNRSEEFPQMGEGGRTAIGGPIYHYNADLKSEIKFPQYFDKAWFIGDWMRNWVKAVKLDGSREVERIDGIMPGTNFNKPVAMDFSPTDGALYLLEFGNTWGRNNEARLVRIEYNSGNRTPVAELEADAVTGRQPLTVRFSAKGSFDYDGDMLEYSWRVSGVKLDNNTDTLEHTFDSPGLYRVELTVADPSGTDSVKAIDIKVGNTKPALSLTLDNQSFYWNGMSYKANLTDAEDGTLNDGINSDDIKMNLVYQPKVGKTIVREGKIFYRGEVLLNESDCNGCHTMDAASVGPPFRQIANRYFAEAEKNGSVITRLALNIVNGSTGVWFSDRAMSAHPQLNKEQCEEIAEYILSLARKPPEIKSIPVEGKLSVPASVRERREGLFSFDISYTDKGGEVVGPMTSSVRKVLRYPRVYAHDFDEIPFFEITAQNALSGETLSYAVLKDIDLSNINAVELQAKLDGVVEMTLDSLGGRLITTFLWHDSNNGVRIRRDISVMDVGQSKHDLYFRYINTVDPLKKIEIDWIHFLNDLNK